MSDEPWERLKPLLKLERTGPGRPIVLEMRAVVNAIFSVLRTGCQWSELAKEYPNHNSVYSHDAKWRDNSTWQVVMRRCDRQESQGAQDRTEQGQLLDMVPAAKIGNSHLWQIKRMVAHVSNML